MKSLTGISLLLLLAFAGASEARGYESAVRLRGEAVVQGDAIYLSDLLPTLAPDSVRAAAAKVLIGTAPQPGSTRILYGPQIASLLGADNAFSTLEVPHQILVQRSGRSITRDEIVSAIRKVLVSAGFSADQVQPEDLNYSSSVVISDVAGAPLSVTHMNFDSGLQQVRFLMKSGSDRRSLPFLVTARLRGSVSTVVTSHDIAPGQILTDTDLRTEVRTANSAQAISGVKIEQLAGKRAAAAVGSGTALRSADFSTVPMVQAGKMASLSVSSGSMEMLLDVVPLERGTLGETIRVKLPASGKVFRAKVVAAGRLKASL